MCLSGFCLSSEKGSTFAPSGILVHCIRGTRYLAAISKCYSNCCFFTGKCVSKGCFLAVEFVLEPWVTICFFNPI